MRKDIFLEYKFGDYDNVVLRSSGANEVVAWMENLNPHRIEQLKKWGVRIGLSFAATAHGVCPLDPTTKIRLEKLLMQAANDGPDFLCLDHLRFDGYWEGINNTGEMPDTHPPCQYCQDSNRSKSIVELAGWIKEKLPSNIELGYFAVPFYPEHLQILGQDHQKLAAHCDFTSPMLYQRMIGKPVGYIHEYTGYLADLTHKPVIPAIAVKDMPDNLEDKIDEVVLQQEYEQATLPPSAGVCWFSWDGAIEKHKSQTLATIWSK